MKTEHGGKCGCGVILWYSKMEANLSTLSGSSESKHKKMKITFYFDWRYVCFSFNAVRVWMEPRKKIAIRICASVFGLKGGTGRFAYSTDRKGARGGTPPSGNHDVTVYSFRQFFPDGRQILPTLPGSVAFSDRLHGLFGIQVIGEEALVSKTTLFENINGKSMVMRAWNNSLVLD